MDEIRHSLMLLSAALERCVWLEPYTCVYSYMCIETNVCMHICMYLLSSLTYIHSFGEWLSPVPRKSYGFFMRSHCFLTPFSSPWGPPTGPPPGGEGPQGDPLRAECLQPPAAAPHGPPRKGIPGVFWFPLNFIGFPWIFFPWSS